MVALCAQRSGMDPWEYYCTRTEGQFSLDVEAWIQTWAFPASVFLGGLGDDKGGKTTERTRAARRKFKAGPNQSVVDLDAMDNPENVHKIAAVLGKSIPVANQAKKEEAWARPIKSEIDLRKLRPVTK